MKEIIFAVSLNPDDVYVAEAFCYSITVHAETPGELRCRVRDAVQHHFQDIEQKPATIRLHYTHYEEIKITQPPEQEATWREACSEYSEHVFIGNTTPADNFGREACSEYSEHASLDLEARAAPILGFKQQSER